MSERYVVRKHPEFSSWQVWDTEDNVQVSRSWWERFDAQEHADKCNGKIDELASLQQANAELLQVVESQSEKLGEARQFIRELADRPLDINDGYRHVIYNSVVIAAKEMQAQWESEVETSPEPASGGFTGYVAKIKKLLTKNNEVMAIMAINGNECIAFPRTWQEYGKVLESGKELQIVYKEDNSKGYPQFIIESAGFLYESEVMITESEAE